MSEGNGLPKGWAEATLFTSCEKIQDGTHFSPPQKSQKPSGGFPYVTAKNVRPWGMDLDSLTYLEESEHRPIYERCDARKGDVLLVKDGVNAGDACVNTIEGEVSLLSSVCMIRPRGDLLDARFLRYYLLSPQAYRSLTGKMTGTAIKRIILAKVRDTGSPIAPLPEQHRIVAKIEELFSHLDAAVASLQRAKANLKRYRASVLKSAVEGRLTEDWRKEHPQAEDGQMLLDRILRERREKWERDQLAKFKEKGKEPPKNWQSKYVEPSAPDASELAELPEGWVWASLEAVSEVTGGITKDKKKDTLPGMLEVPYLRVANVQRGSLDLSDMKTIKASSEDIRELALRKGDVLFTEGGDRDKLGRGWVWAEELRECIHQNHIFRARLITTGFQPSLVSHHGNTFGREWFTKAGKQTTNLASINLGILERFPVPIAPLAEQQQIVALAEERLSQIDAAEKTIDAELIRAKRLRQSILKRAFEGKLVPQDPSDEPASVLLERIQLDRTKASRDGKRPTRPRRARRSP